MEAIRIITQDCHVSHVTPRVLMRANGLRKSQKALSCQLVHVGSMSSLQGRLASAPSNELSGAQGQAASPAERIANGVAVVVLVVMVLVYFHSILELTLPNQQQ